MSKDSRTVRDVEDAILHLPCKWYEYPETVTTTVFDVHDYGRAIPRGLVVHENELWIVSCGLDGSYWRLEAKVSDVAFQRGGNFTKWMNYLIRIARWPWKDEDTKEIIDASKGTTKTS